MKLIQKTFIYYLIYSSFIFTIGTVVFFFSIKEILFDGIDEALHQEKIQLLDNFKYETDFNNFEESDYLRIVKLNTPKPTFDRYSTVQIDDNGGKSVDYRQLYSIAVSNNHYYEITIRQSLSEVKTLINAILPIEMILFIGLIIGVLLINRVVSKKIWAPFYEVLEKISSYETSELHVISFLPTDVYEFDELNKGIEKMTNKIYNDYVSQKEFHEYSSHELQTPLAIIRNKLELLIQSKNLSEEDLQIISSLFDVVRRLSSLNKNLLLLSKIDNNQFATTESVQLDKLVNNQLNNLSEIIQDKKIHLSTVILPNVIIKANYFLIETLCYNLLSNSINHNLPSGYIQVILNHDYLKIINTGSIPETEIKNLFERFRKGNTSASSVGLGLSIVKKIADLYKFKLQYTIEEDKHILLLIY
jgi:signal transduction histidine kinase